MGLDDWLVALHLLAAAALVAALVVLAVVAAALRGTDVPAPTLRLGRLARVGTATIILGTLGTLLTGVWLAISLDGVALRDGWVIAGIVLWALVTGAGQKAGAEYGRSLDLANELDASGRAGASAELAARNRTAMGQAMLALAGAAALAVLVVMIWKPGA